jgi:hypothetical protein
MQMNYRTYFYSRFVAVLAFSTIIASGLSAQDSTKNLALNDAIETALRNNKSIHLAKLDGDIATANYRPLPRLYLSARKRKVWRTT